MILHRQQDVHTLLPEPLLSLYRPLHLPLRYARQTQHCGSSERKRVYLNEIEERVGGKKEKKREKQQRSIKHTWQLLLFRRGRIAPRNRMKVRTNNIHAALNHLPPARLRRTGKKKGKTCMGDKTSDLQRSQKW